MVGRSSLCLYVRNGRRPIRVRTDGGSCGYTCINYIYIYMCEIIQREIQACIEYVHSVDLKKPCTM